MIFHTFLSSLYLCSAGSWSSPPDRASMLGLYPTANLGMSHSIITLRFQPIRSRCMRWLFLNNHLLKINNHLPLQFTHRISVSWMVCRTMTCICFGCSALPPRFSEFIHRTIATSKNTLTCLSYNRIEINNLLEVVVQISKTSLGFCNNLGLRPRLLPDPTSVFDICTNTSNSLFISMIKVFSNSQSLLFIITIIAQRYTA